jgi:hypothetical protein
MAVVTATLSFPTDTQARLPGLPGKRSASGTVPRTEVPVLGVRGPALAPRSVLNDVIHGRNEYLDRTGDDQGIPAAVEITQDRTATQGHRLPPYSSTSMESPLRQVTFRAIP